jgi:intracellular multiplication protein IcmE
MEKNEPHLTDPILDSNFDPHLDNQMKELERQQRSSNIQKVFGSGTGRVAAIVVALAFVAMAAVGAYNLFSKSNTPPPAPPNARGAVLNQPSQGGDPTVQTEEEAQLRRKATAQQAEAAAAAGKPYLAPAVLKDESKPEAETISQAERERRAQAERDKQQKPPTQTPEERSASAPPPVTPQRTLPQDFEKQINAQIAAALGRKDDGQRMSAFTSVSYALPDRTAGSTNSTAASNTGAAASATTINQQGPLLVNAGYGYYCELRYGANSDNARKEVFADCYQGPVKGATVVGKYELSPDNGGDPSMGITFDKLSRPGKPTLAITAIGIDDETEEAGMADDVNSHSVVKYGGLAVASMLKGIGKAAQMVTGTQSTQTIGNVSTTTTTTDPIDAARQVKITAGEVGTTFSDVLQKRAESIKDTVKLRKKKGIRVVFLADVFESTAK